ncbi:Pertussis toxin liberation protein G [Hydrogenophaga sp. T4]|nr:Pertussis toxin liberation protein G [Hydrogenophaga sp. T4]
MSDTDQMSPAASPGAVSKKSGVRRVNNVPMYILGGVVACFLLIMALVAADRAAKQNEKDEAAKQKAGNASMFAKELVGDQADGLIQPAAPLVVPNLDAPPILVARPDLEAPPAPLSAPVQDDEANRIRQAKMQMLDEAIKAKTGVQMVAPRSAGQAGGASTRTPQTREEMLARIAEVRQQIGAQQGSDDPTAAYQARMAQMKAMTPGAAGSGAGSGGSSAGLMQTAGAANKSGMTQFNGAADRWRLDSELEAPRSPYELRAGFVLPATLISGINSELPGQIVAQVAQGVYDTATGKHLLVPQGSRLIGSYSSDVQYGQARVLVAWQRIVFPDGKAMDIGAMPGADSAGYSGFNDQVNNHYVRLFASAILMSGVTAGISYSQTPVSSTTGVDGETLTRTSAARNALSESLGQQLGQVTAQMIAKNLSIAPTLEIRPGYRFNVVVTKDMTFSKPYRSFDY